MRYTCVCGAIHDNEFGPCKNCMKKFASDRRKEDLVIARRRQKLVDAYVAGLNNGHCLTVQGAFDNAPGTQRELAEKWLAASVWG